MSVFVIVDISIKNPEEYKQYIAEITPSLQKYQGRYWVRGGDPETLEGAWQSSRIVIMEYPDRDTARAWLHAPDLKAIHDKRRKNAHFCNMIICDTLE
ncbi:MAG: DUF1330 domain-containing protein [Cellvibrionaceae bacterium]|nr:DUF1330 domain-containing protein [Cellvibrionaceae bacterium]